METMRKYLIICSIVLLSAKAGFAQTTAQVQNAFAESYKAEQGGNYSQAISALKGVYQSDDYSINARLGWLLFLSKQYTESISYYEKSVKLKPYAIEVRFGLIKNYNALESWDKVKEQYEAILKIDSQNTTSLYWLGVIFYNRKDYDNAAKNFEKIVNLYPMDYGSVIMLAWTKLYQGKKTEALVLFNQALILSPNDASAMSGLNQLK
jgi:tetratricopeptide (TPR) repeat protein